MSKSQTALDIRPRLLYRIAKAAWDGKLLQPTEEVCRLIHEEFKDIVSLQYVTSQIRLALGLSLLSSADGNQADIPYHPVIADASLCRSCPTNQRSCEAACPFQAIGHDDNGRLFINYDKCMSEGSCLNACQMGALSEKSQFVPLIHLLQQRTHPVYASVAPAFSGQFGPNVTPGKLRSALIALGFADMVETALYADLVTMKEAFEFDHYVKTADDFLLTSCCCPVWIKLIQTKFPELIDHISPSVSPMIASGRVIKALNANAKVVFIGPCVAKKAEAALPDLKGDIDFVLTFQELKTMFEAADIHLEQQPDDASHQASLSGRIYAKTGGVSTAVYNTLKRLLPEKAETLRTHCVDGIADCQTLLTALQTGAIDANFIEGMACKGGCVGGPARLIDIEQGRAHVTAYGNAADAQTPADNLNVYALLHAINQKDQKSNDDASGAMNRLLARQLK